MDSVGLESSSVQASLSILQGVINRMAANSANCKTWCITLVSAIVVVIATQETPEYIWIALIPIVLFAFLDSYYLGLERSFIRQYNDLVKQVHEGNATVNNVYVVSAISGARNTALAIGNAFKSLSIWPLYGMLLLMLVVSRFVILPASCP